MCVCVIVCMLYDYVDICVYERKKDTNKHKEIVIDLIQKRGGEESRKCMEMCDGSQCLLPRPKVDDLQKYTNEHHFKQSFPQ